MPKGFPERHDDVNAVKEGLLQSKDIFNLLANLYSFCSDKFIPIYNLLQDELGQQKFRDCFHTFKQELLETMSLDIFITNFQKVLGVLKKNKESTENDYLISLWAFLKAIDWAVSDDTVYLNKMRAIKCKTSEPFEQKKYRLLLKPRNLIFNTIENEMVMGKIKTGIDIGQRIEDQLQKISLYEELSGRKIKFKLADLIVNELLLNQGTNLAFAVSPICYDYKYSFKRFEDEGFPRHSAHFIFRKINNWKEIARVIDTRLKECINENVHIVVFPELSIDEDLRKHISNWLKTNNRDMKIIMVIAGSYHILQDKREAKYENSCIVYRFDGKELWEQKKMNRFQLDEEDIKELRAFKWSGLQSFIKLFRASDRRGEEHIEISDTLVLYDSPIGRMAVAICLDFIVKENVRLLLDPQVNIVFLPTMSFSLKKMKSTNFTLGNFGAASVFCANSCWIRIGVEESKLEGKFNSGLASYIYIPHKDDPKILKCSTDRDCLRCKPEIFRISEICEKGALQSKLNHTLP